MTPVTIDQIAAEWANKILSGRTAFSTDLVAMPELQDDYLQRQASLIESQATVAAAAWARRRDEDPAKVPAKTVAAVAEKIAVAVAMASEAQANADTQIAARLHVTAED